MIEYIWGIDERDGKQYPRKYEVLDVRIANPEASCGESRDWHLPPECCYTTEEEAKKVCIEANKPKVGEKVRVRIIYPGDMAYPSDQPDRRAEAVRYGASVEGILVQYREELAIVWWAENTTPLYCYLDEIEAVR